MKQSKNWVKLAGRGIHVLVGAFMVVGGIVKLAGLIPADHVEKMGLTSHFMLIGAGETLIGILLMFNPTFPLGVLLGSSFWGGAICLHMSHHESYLPASLFLLVTWLGHYLRSQPTVNEDRRQQQSVDSKPIEELVLEH